MFIKNTVVQKPLLPVNRPASVSALAKFFNEPFQDRQDACIIETLDLMRKDLVWALHNAHASYYLLGKLHLLAQF